MRDYILQNDPYRMNWVEGSTEWGTVKCPEGLSCRKTSVRTGDIVRERYVFTNTTQKDLYTSLADVAIYTPFNDDYPDAATCVTNRCHTHIWCGGQAAWVMALRMGGAPPHAGLVLTEGALDGYSVERDLSRISNDRGDLLLHPAPAALAPGQSFAVAWVLFPHTGRADFFAKARQLAPRWVGVEAERYVLFAGEAAKLRIAPAFAWRQVRVSKNGVPLPAARQGDEITVTDVPDTLGETRYDIDIDGVATHCAVYALPAPAALAAGRCRFIAERQQCHDPASRLDGAYLVYDNEEEHRWYSPAYDRNAGRERVGMALAMAKYLQHSPDPALRQSLDEYAAFAARELVDEASGEVFNDAGRDNSYKRLYNAPWYALLYLELYRLTGEESRLLVAYRILRRFYAEGGGRFYAIEIPADSIVPLLRQAGRAAEADELLADFERHCGFLLRTGLNYPAHEVHYEQSIVAPAADLLLKVYALTGKPEYLAGAEVHLNALDLFNGVQPDYHMHEVAIRHWDGYWFGKRRLYGDTFPHYWSALTGRVFLRYAALTGKAEYRARGEASLRGVLSLFDGTGRATCAFVYPQTVNGVPAHGADPYANDQDWALYFWLCAQKDAGGCQKSGEGI